MLMLRFSPLSTVLLNTMGYCFSQHVIAWALLVKLFCMSGQDGELFVLPDPEGIGFDQCLICLGSEHVEYEVQQALTEPCPNCSIMLLVTQEASLPGYGNTASLTAVHSSEENSRLTTEPLAFTELTQKKQKPSC